MGKRRFNKRGNKGGSETRPYDAVDRKDKGTLEEGYISIPKENEQFEKYYKMQKLCPENEWEDFMRTCRDSLPTSFRITGSRSESKAMLHIIENRLFKDVIEAAKSDDVEQVNIKPFPLPWYRPERMAWQFNLTRKDIRSNEAYLRFHNFLISETESGNISRQEAVSMIPPLVLKVESFHKVLDMCASPGSKTAQIIEMLHADETKVPEGYVIANDVDNKRCYMLVHQGKRLQSPAFVVTNHDAARFPELTTTNSEGVTVPLKFDRVLCDVPCSGDGTIRKNVDVWKKWNPSNSLYLQQLQYQILKRGMEVCAVGGLLVYSTCSLNPQEDEAVVHRLLKEANGTVELLDIDLPNLKHSKGMTHWQVCDRDLNVYEKLEDVPERWITTIRPGAYPPPEDNSFNLEKCVRVLPHQQNTGGFFIALLSKKTALPWEASEATTENSKETTTNGNGESKNSKEETPEAKPPAPKKQRRMQGYKEDPYFFMTDDHEIWPQVKAFYGLDGTFKSTNFIRRTENEKVKNLYLTTESVRDFVLNNEKSVKIINVGVKAIVRIDNKWSSCNFRLCQEGLPSLGPDIKSRRINVTKEDLIIMLEQTEEDKAPLLEQFSFQTIDKIKDMERGSLVLVCDVMSENGPSFRLNLVGWKGAESLRAYVQKNDRLHYLRLCGVDTVKYEANKYKEKEMKEDSNTNEVTIVTNDDSEMADLKKTVKST